MSPQRKTASGRPTRAEAVSFSEAARCFPEPTILRRLESRFRCGGCVVSWDSRFAEPIVLPDGANLASLRESIAHLVKTIPAAERRSPAVLTAAEMLTAAAENRGPIEFARIATLRALNDHAVHVFDPDRKNPHWGRKRSTG
jgi:hypothetical protein